MLFNENLLTNKYSKALSLVISTENCQKDKISALLQGNSLVKWRMISTNEGKFVCLYLLQK